eukprot:TRINITY_DN3920_c0_g1_i1.p1 TRINITY_DN3920_c0_g1~~TRINITY_DN3920_c0_g1_i1.p1  ORF type:complete len:855 (+),score=198.59 TRINITY_DN3920_c0_g1_i1:841-3405(+)
MNKIALALLMLIACAFATTDVDMASATESELASSEEPALETEQDVASNDEDVEEDDVDVESEDNDFASVDSEYEDLANESDAEDLQDADMGQPVCVSAGDPHIRSFRGQRFDIYGVKNHWVTMLRYKDLSVQVYMIQQGPWGHRSMNRYVRVFYKRRQIQYVGVNQNRHFHLPYGFRIKTHWHRHRHWVWNDIHIWAPNGAAANGSKGLCTRNGHGHNWAGWLHKADAILKKSGNYRNHINGQCHRLRNVNRALFYDCVYDKYQLFSNDIVTCYSTGDPHYRSFFNRGFNIYGRQGPVTLYKKGNVEIKTIVKYMKPWSNRGLNTDLIVTKGGRKVTHLTNKNFHGHRRVHIAHGFYIDVYRRQWSRYTWLDIFVRQVRRLVTENQHGASGACFHGGHLSNWSGWLHRANAQLKKVSRSQAHNIRNWCNRERRTTSNTHLAFYDCVVDRVNSYKKEKVTCRSTGDPHITTFDRRTWHLYNKEGWMVLMKYKALTIRTHINFTKRWRTRGVNDHVQVIYKGKTVGSWNANSNDRSVTTNKKLPYGFTLTLRRNVSGNTRWIDVYVRGFAHAALKSTGLCRHRGKLNNWRGWLTKAQKLLNKIKNSRERFEISKRCHAHRGWGFSYFYDCVFDKYTFYVKGHRYGNKHRNAHKYVVKKLHKKHTDWFHAGNHAFLRHLRNTYLEKLKRYRHKYHAYINHMKRTILRKRAQYQKIMRHNLHVRRVTVARTTKAIKHARHIIRVTTKQWRTKKTYYWDNLLRELHHAHMWYKKIRAVYVKKQQTLIRRRLAALRAKFKYNNDKNLVMKYCFQQHKNVHTNGYAACINSFQANCKVQKKLTKVCQKGQCTKKVHYVRHC